MSLQKDIIEAEVKISSNEAQASLTKLSSETAELRNENERLRITQAKLKALGKEHTEEYKKVTAAIKQNNDTIKANKGQMDALRKTLSLSDQTYSQLSRRAAELKRELLAMGDAADTAEFKKMKKELGEVDAQMKKLRSQIGLTHGSMSRMGSSGVQILTKFKVGVLAVIGSIIAAIKKFKQAADAAMEFEERLDNLASITGLTGNNLEWLGSKAKELATTTLEGGINITKSATDIVDAFTKVGSARPELLGNKEALAEVTKQALILSEAAKMELDPAIAAVTAVMNQFGEDASQSGRIINALAAGSQEGSAEIDNLTESMKNVGTVAASSNMTLEETIAALEVVGEKQLLGAEAGTKLRGAILKLKEAGVGYASGQFNLRDALDEVNKKLAKQSTELEKDELRQKIFGATNVTVGTILLQNVDKYDQLTKAVTGTDAAIRQASRNTNNAKAILAKSRNEFNVAAIELGNNLSPAITTVYKAAGKLATAFSDLIKASPADQLRKEGHQVNALAVELTNSNTPLERRQTILKELKDINPDIVSGLDAEKLSYDELRKNLEKYNEELSNRIVLENLTEDERKYAAEVAKLKTEEAKLQLRMGSIMAEIDQEIAFSEATMKEKYEKIKEAYGDKAMSANSNLVFDNKEEEEEAARMANLAVKLSELNDLYEELGSTTEKLGKGKDMQKKYAEESEAIQKILGLKKELNNENEKGNKTKTGSTGGTKKSKEEIKEQIEVLEASYNKELTLIKKRHLEGKTTEDQYNAELLQAELKFYADKLKIYNTGSKEYEQTLVQALNKQVEVDKTIKALLLEAEKELASAKITTIKDAFEQQEAAENQRWANEKAALEKRIIKKETLNEQEIALNDNLKQILEEKEIAHQEALQKIKSAANVKEYEDKLKSATPVDEKYATAEQQQIYFEARAALIEAQYEREQELAGDNQTALLAAEQDYNAKMYKLKQDQIDADYALTQARVATARDMVSQLQGIFAEHTVAAKALFAFEKALAIGEVWINIAKANAEAVAASPLTGGLPWVAINTAYGAIQTALIASQAVANFTGKKTGGYTDKASTDDQVVDYVHSNEFVVNAKAVRNPTVKPILDIIDLAQKQGKIATLNLPAVLGSIGRRSGGYGGFPAVPSSGQVTSKEKETVGYREDPEMKKLLKSLNFQLKRGIKASVRKYGKGGLDESIRDINKFNSKVGRS